MGVSPPWGVPSRSPRARPRWRRRGRCHGNTPGAGGDARARAGLGGSATAAERCAGPVLAGITGSAAGAAPAPLHCPRWAVTGSSGVPAGPAPGPASAPPGPPPLPERGYKTGRCGSGGCALCGDRGTGSGAVALCWRHRRCCSSAAAPARPTGSAGRWRNHSGRVTAPGLGPAAPAPRGGRVSGGTARETPRAGSGHRMGGTLHAAPAVGARRDRRVRGGVRITDCGDAAGGARCASRGAEVPAARRAGGILGAQGSRQHGVRGGAGTPCGRRCGGAGVPASRGCGGAAARSPPPRSSPSPVSRFALTLGKAPTRPIYGSSEPNPRALPRGEQPGDPRRARGVPLGPATPAPLPRYPPPRTEPRALRNAAAGSGGANRARGRLRALRSPRLPLAASSGAPDPPSPPNPPDPRSPGGPSCAGSAGCAPVGGTGGGRGLKWVGLVGGRDLGVGGA